MAERDIRKELKDRVEYYDGEIRAVQWINRHSAPDVLCLFRADGLYGLKYAESPHDLHPMVETKAPGGEPNDNQMREHVKLRRAGIIVKVISTIEQLDAWLPPRAAR